MNFERMKAIISIWTYYFKNSKQLRKEAKERRRQFDEIVRKATGQKPQSDFQKFFALYKGQLEYRRSLTAGKKIKYKSLSEFIRINEICKPLEEAGFVPLGQNYAYWHKLDGDILYTVFFYEYYSLSVYYRVTPIHDYLWVPYNLYDQEHSMRTFILNYCGCCNNELTFLKAMNEEAFADIKESLSESIQYEILPHFDRHRTMYDVANDDKTYRISFFRAPSAFFGKNKDVFEDGAEYYKKCWNNVYDTQEPALDWQSWESAHNKAIGTALAKDDISIYADFLQKSKEMNLEQLRKIAPEILGE